MTGQTLILRGPSQRAIAHQLVERAPMDAVLNIREATRSSDQNALMWALLSDVSRAMPGGRRLTADVWKCVFMNACGHAVQFETGLSGEPFPIGFRSSRLSKKQMNELIEFVLQWGTENGVQWSGLARGEAA